MGIWVAGGNGTNKIVTSRNGTDWLPATLFGGLTACYSVAYNGVDKWIAGGDGSFLATSSDGTNWYAVPSNKISGFEGSVLGVAYGNGLWIACNSNTSMAYSNTNGTSWTVITSVAGFSTIRGIAYGGGLWVAVGNDYVGGWQHGKIAYSPTGSAWTTVPTGSMGGLYASGSNSSYIFSVTYDNGLWVAGGNYGSKFATSTTGTSWNAALSNGGIGAATGIASKPPV